MPASTVLPIGSHADAHDDGMESVFCENCRHPENQSDSSSTVHQECADNSTLYCFISSFFGQRIPDKYKHAISADRSSSDVRSEHINGKWMVMNSQNVAGSFIAPKVELTLRNTIFF